MLSVNPFSMTEYARTMKALTCDSEKLMRCLLRVYKQNEKYL